MVGNDGSCGDKQLHVCVCVRVSWPVHGCSEGGRVVQSHPHPPCFGIGMLKRVEEGGLVLRKL